jgi:hypothetical protein
MYRESAREVISINILDQLLLKQRIYLNDFCYIKFEDIAKTNENNYKYPIIKHPVCFCLTDISLRLSKNRTAVIVNEYINSLEIVIKTLRNVISELEKCNGKAYKA